MEPLLYNTVGDLIDLAPDRYGDRMAIIDCSQGIRKTFMEYVKDINKLTLGFLALNLKRGDRIGIWSPNRYEWALTQFAAANAGLILVTLSPALQEAELGYCIEKLGIRAIVFADKFRTRDYYEMILNLIPEIMDCKPGHIKTKKYPNLDTLIVMTEKDAPLGAYKFEDLMNVGGIKEKMQLEKLKKEIRVDDAVNVQFTSGTTGRPKAVTLSHFNVINTCHFMSQRIGFYHGINRICSSVPLFHCFGCVCVTAIGLCTGTCAVFSSQSFSAEHTLKAIEREKCTTIYGTPTMFHDILVHPNFNKTDLSSLRTGVMAGAPCPPELIQRVIEDMHCPGLTIAYGATETSPAITCHANPYETKETRMSNVGRILPATEVKIVDKNNRMVPFGQQGEICARGYQVMIGYWDDDEETEKCLKDRWYHTGDIGTLSEDGYITVNGRIKDMIIRGGENIYPVEVEVFLTSLPKIQDAQVIGVPDQRLGEEVCAWIKLKEKEEMTEDEVKNACKFKLAHYKIPKYIRFVADFPRTTTGKIHKMLIREEMAQIVNNQKKSYLINNN